MLRVFRDPAAYGREARLTDTDISGRRDGVKLEERRRARAVHSVHARHDLLERRRGCGVHEARGAPLLHVQLLPVTRRAVDEAVDPWVYRRLAVGVALHVLHEIDTPSEMQS